MDGQTESTQFPTADQIPNEVKVAIEKSVQESNRKNSDQGGDDTKGGFHETSGLAFPAASGNPDASVHYDVSPGVPGKASDPRKGGADTTYAPADPSLLANASPTRIRWFAWHVHPRGQKENKGFAQPPSDVDRLRAEDPGVINIVVGARNNRVYLYNTEGAVRSMSWEEFIHPNYNLDVIFP
jgi:hypothetical protein